MLRPPLVGTKQSIVLHPSLQGTKQSTHSLALWIASQARNDEKRDMSLVMGMKNQTAESDRYSCHCENRTCHCEVVIERSRNKQSNPVLSITNCKLRIWIASQARNDEKRDTSLRGTKQSTHSLALWIASQSRNDEIRNTSLRGTKQSRNYTENSYEVFF